MAESATQALKILAYLHPVSDDCVTTDSTAYTNPRELVLKSAAQELFDEIDDLDEGLSQWRAIAIDGAALAYRLLASRKLGVGMNGPGTVVVTDEDLCALKRMAAWHQIDLAVAAHQSQQQQECETGGQHE